MCVCVLYISGAAHLMCIVHVFMFFVYLYLFDLDVGRVCGNNICVDVCIMVTTTIGDNSNTYFFLFGWICLDMCVWIGGGRNVVGVVKCVEQVRRAIKCASIVWFLWKYNICL